MTVFFYLSSISLSDFKRNVQWWTPYGEIVNATVLASAYFDHLGPLESDKCIIS